MQGPANATDGVPQDDDVSSVRNAQATRDDARLAHERAKALSNRGIVSPVDLQTAERFLEAG